MNTHFEFDLQTYLKQMEDRITSAVTDVGLQVEGLDTRVQSLEKWRNYLAGAWAVVTALFTYKVAK